MKHRALRLEKSAFEVFLCQITIWIAGKLPSLRNKSQGNSPQIQGRWKRDIMRLTAEPEVGTDSLASSRYKIGDHNRRYMPQARQHMLLVHNFLLLRNNSQSARPQSHQATSKWLWLWCYLTSKSGRYRIYGTSLRPTGATHQKQTPHLLTKFLSQHPHARNRGTTIISTSSQWWRRGYATRYISSTPSQGAGTALSLLEFCMGYNQDSAPFK